MKTLERRHHESQLQEISTRMKELDEIIKSLHFKVPDKEKFAKEKTEINQTLNDIKCKRENQFSEKRLIDAELKSLNHDITTKFDDIGKLRSKLRYKTQEKVDEIVIKLEKQLPKLKMKPLEQRRIEQEIADLRGSKVKIVEYEKLGKEVHILKEKQKELRTKKDENIKQITTIKQQEAAAKASLESHKQTVNEAWDDYKSNLSKRDSLRYERDDLQKKRREITEKYRKYLEFSKHKNDSDKANLKHDAEEKGKEKNKAKSVIEKKKPYEAEINSCDILLSILDKYTSQHQSTTAPEENRSKNINQSSESTDIVDGQASVKPKEDIYRGVRRRPSKKERRRRHSELPKKIDLHVTVLERFLFLGMQPPSTLADLIAATTELQNKKKTFLKDQLRMLKQSEIRRAKSIPTLSPDSAMKADSFDKQDESDTTNSDLSGQKLTLTLSLSRRHKSCPSLVSDAAAKQYIDLESPGSSITKDLSSNASDYELDSPLSVTSSTSFVDRETRTDFVDGKMDADYTTKGSVETEEEKAGNRFWKPHHKVHFSKEVIELDQEIRPVVKQGSTWLNEQNDDKVNEDFREVNERFNEQVSQSINDDKYEHVDRRVIESPNTNINEKFNGQFDGHVDDKVNKQVTEGDAMVGSKPGNINTNENQSWLINDELDKSLKESRKMAGEPSEQHINNKSTAVLEEFNTVNKKDFADSKHLFLWNNKTDNIGESKMSIDNEMIFEIELQNNSCSFKTEEKQLSLNTSRPDNKDGKLDSQVVDSNTENIHIRNEFSGTSEEKDSCRDSLMFAGDSCKDSLKTEEGLVHLDNANYSEPASLKENSDAFLQFPIDDLCEVDSETEIQHKKKANSKSCGIRITEAFSIPSRGSASGCSPRKSSHEIIALDQNGEEGVPVKT